MKDIDKQKDLYAKYLRESILSLKNDPYYKRIYRDCKLELICNSDIVYDDFINNFIKSIDLIDDIERDLENKSIDEYDEITDRLNRIYAYLQYLSEFKC